MKHQMTVDEYLSLKPGSIQTLSPTETKLSATKHDSDKPDLSLLSPIAMTEIAKVMTFGAKKYSRDNWRGGFKYSRVIAAILRHVFAYMSGEKKDPETGLSHLAHAGCGIQFLLEFEKTGAGEDDLYQQK